MTVHRSSTAPAADVTSVLDLRERAPVTIVWQGDLDIASGPLLAAALQVLARARVHAVDLDLSDVTFMDCGGLGVLVEGDVRLGGGLRLAGASSPVRRLLALVDLQDRFATAPTGPPEPSPVDPRVTLEQTTGLLMASFRCTARQAAKILVSTARSHNLDVHVLAALLVAVASADLGAGPDGPARAVQRVVRCGSPVR